LTKLAESLCACEAARCLYYLRDAQFISKIGPDGDGCRLWVRSLNSEGYGQFWNGHRGVRAHRYSYELHHGVTVPTDLLVLHTCDNRACIKVDHLFVGTVADNKADEIAKRRHRFGSKAPRAKLTEAQIPEIRRLLARGDLRASQIGAMFGVKDDAIWRIACGRRWRHVPNEGLKEGGVL
jgi:hypothetical protein